MYINLRLSILGLLLPADKSGSFFFGGGKGGSLVADADIIRNGVNHRKKGIAVEEYSAAATAFDRHDVFDDVDHGGKFAAGSSGGEVFSDIDEIVGGDIVGGSTSNILSFGIDEGPATVNAAVRGGVTLRDIGIEMHSTAEADSIIDSDEIEKDKHGDAIKYYNNDGNKQKMSTEASGVKEPEAVSRALKRVKKSVCRPDNSRFRFISVNKRGVSKDKGDCDFVSKKKRRCRKKIRRVKVRNQCPITCGVPCIKPTAPPEGTFLYTGCSSNIFQIDISCDELSNNLDSCKYEERKVGYITEDSSEEGATPLAGGNFYVLYNDAIGRDDLDEEKVCIRAGIFGSSSTVQGETPFVVTLSTISNGCESAFEYFLQIDVLSDGNLKLSFSVDNGLSFYTDDIDCKTSYVAQRDNEQRLLLATESKDGQYHPELLDFVPCTSSSCAIATTDIIEARFPTGVFDKARARDSEYMSNLRRRCVDSTKSIPGEILGCKIYFILSEVLHLFALGPIKVGVDLLNAKEELGYPQGQGQDTYTNIFVPEAMAVMIDEKCFSYRTENLQFTQKSSYATTSELKSAYKNSKSMKIDVEGSYGPVSANAAFEIGQSQSGSTSSSKQYAYAEKKFFAGVGLLTNRCFSSSRSGFVPSMETIVTNGLVKKEFERAWRTVRSVDFGGSSPIDYYRDSDFRLIAEAGFLLPSTYRYGVEVNYSMKTSYEKTSSESTTVMSAAMKAGVDYSIPFSSSVKVNVEAEVQKVVDSKLKTSAERLTVSASSIGSNGAISTACLNDNSCEAKTKFSANLIGQDIALLQTPLFASSFISMDTFVNYYFEAKGEGSLFNERLGFPRGFERFVNEYYSYQKCRVTSLVDISLFGSRPWVGSGKYEPWPTPSFIKDYDISVTFRGDGTVVRDSLKLCDIGCTSSKRFLYTKADENKAFICEVPSCNADIRFGPTDAYNGRVFDVCEEKITQQRADRLFNFM